MYVEKKRNMVDFEIEEGQTANSAFRTSSKCAYGDKFASVYICICACVHAFMRVYINICACLVF